MAGNKSMKDGIKRRDFLRVLGVSGAGATLTGCSTEKVERLLPYVVAPDDITPGVSTWYTTVCGGCSAQCGMWVRTREGRAIQVEGNPNHPVSEGGLCAKGHATLQHLYHPDRFLGPMMRDGSELRQVTWEEAESLLAARLGSAQNPMLISGRMGPSLNKLVDEFVEGIGGVRVSYDAISDAPLAEAARIVYGTAGIPQYDIENARLLLSFGNDFIETGSSPVAHNKGLARMSSVDAAGSKGRFVYLGPRLSLTGLNADKWIPIRPGTEAAVALAMAAVIAGDDPEAAGPYSNVLQAYNPRVAAQVAGVTEDAIYELAEDFVSEAPTLALGPGVGAHHRGATAANIAVMILNHVAGNVGRTVLYDAPVNGAVSAYADIEATVSAMASGESEVVMVHGANPVYSMPPQAGFAEAFAQVPFKVSFASALDETSEMADLILPDRHFLEAWGDSSPLAGVIAVQQPVMQPVPHFESRQTGDVLLSVANRLSGEGDAATFYDYLREHHRSAYDEADGDFEDAWQELLRTGMADTRREEARALELQSPEIALSFEVPTFDAPGDLTLLVHPSPRFGAGEFSNSPWLQELPDPVSKIVWHSWLEMNPHTAELRGIRDGDIVTVTSPHGSLEVPVWLYPGIREDVVALAMGGGHTGMGRYADDKGVNALRLLPSTSEQPSGALVTTVTSVTVIPTGENRRLATVEGSSGDQYDRMIAPAVALADLGHAGDDEHEEGGHEELRELQGVGGFIPVPADEGAPTAFPLEGSRHGLYADAQEGPRWAMAIDLDKCTGCSACVTACQAENNVPWVGEEQVLMGRDMNWVRIERFYEQVDATQAGDLDVRFLPMICQHCGNAPCETVCPVFATYHTPEGLNAQVYNRCVGTRYCANNCPYKVRVFNWYRYTDEVPEPLNWQWNPDVTVRDNGVMEKCSFCVQRIREVQNRAALEGGREVRDHEVVPACEQSCPAEAIVFGNIRDPNARITQVSSSERTYRVLEDLNTQPAVNYLKKVTFHEVASVGHEE